MKIKNISLEGREWLTLLNGWSIWFSLCLQFRMDGVFGSPKEVAMPLPPYYLHPNLRSKPNLDDGDAMRRWRG
jgi:hypothetical protein